MPQPFEQPAEPGQGRPDVSASASVEKTFVVSGSCRFSLDNPCGRVRIVGWDQAQIQLQATKRGNPTSARYQATRVETYQDGNTVYARTILDPAAAFADRGAMSGLAAEMLRVFGELIRPASAPAEVEYEVRVPHRADLDVKGVSAAISVQNVQGAIRARSVSGSVEADQITGDLDLGSVSGEISGRDLTGRLALESVSGDVEARGDLSAVRAKTVSGELDLSSPLRRDGAYEFHSVSGNLTLRVPPSTGADVASRGMSSSASCELPCQVTRTGRTPGSHEWHALVNGGGAPVRFQSVSGNLRITALSPMTTSRPAAPPSDQPVAGSPQRTDAAPPTEPVEPAPAQPAMAGAAEPVSPGEPSELGLAVAGEPETAPPSTEPETPFALSPEETESPAVPATEAAPASERAAPVNPAASASDADSQAMQVLKALESGELSVDEALKRLEGLQARGGRS